MDITISQLNKFLTPAQANDVYNILYNGTHSGVNVEFNLRQLTELLLLLDDHPLATTLRERYLNENTIFNIPVINPTIYLRYRDYLQGLLHLMIPTFQYWVQNTDYDTLYMARDQLLTEAEVWIAKQLDNYPEIYVSMSYVSEGSIFTWTAPIYRKTSDYYIVRFNQQPILGCKYKYHRIGLIYYNHELYQFYTAELYEHNIMVNKYYEHIEHGITAMMNRNEIFLFKSTYYSKYIIYFIDGEWYKDKDKIPLMEARAYLWNSLYGGKYFNTDYYTNMADLYLTHTDEEYMFNDLTLTGVKLIGPQVISGNQDWFDLGDIDFVKQAILYTHYIPELNDKYKDLLTNMNLITNLNININRNNNTECYVPLVNHSKHNSPNRFMRQNKIYSAYHADQLNKLLSKLTDTHDLYRGIYGTVCQGDIIIEAGINSKTTNITTAMAFSESNHILYFPTSRVISTVKCADHEENEYVNWTVKQTITGPCRILFYHGRLFQIWTVEEQIIPMFYKTLWDGSPDEQMLRETVMKVRSGRYILTMEKSDRITLMYSKGHVSIPEVKPTNPESWALDSILDVFNRPDSKLGQYTITLHPI